MSENPNEKEHSTQRRRAALILNLLALTIATSALLVFALSPDNGTRVRNSLIATVAPQHDFIWSPVDAPHVFSPDTIDVPVEFQEQAMRASSVSGSAEPGEFQQAVQLARHLVSKKADGGGIRSGDTLRTYEEIQNGRGYCADYSRVFTAMAVSAGIPVRAWGFGLDGFGTGHAFNEIYDSAIGKWVFVDSFYSLYAVQKSTGIPLSVLEMREILSDGQRVNDIQMTPIDPTKFGFKSSEQAVRYYKKGSDQLYLNWGHNAFSDESQTSTKLLAMLPRPVEVAGRIVVGARPDIKILNTESNQAHIDKLFRTKHVFLFLLAATSLLLATLVFQLFQFRRR